jgi:TetR/AcrR family transcriptional repressor of nem operon
MARPRQFNEEDALEAALGCFWRHGYEATTIRMLTRATGLTSASLYNAFGDKRGLFERALDHYVATGFAARAKRLERDLPPRDAILTFFHEMVALSLDDPERKGCLVVNSALDIAPRDPDLQRAIEVVLMDMEGFFLRRVTAAQEDGSLSTRHRPADLARLLLTLLLGLRVLARVRPDADQFQGALRPVRDLLGDPSEAAPRSDPNRRTPP